MRPPTDNALVLGNLSTNIAINGIALKTTFVGLHFCHRKYWCIFNHFYVMRPKTAEFGEITQCIGAIRPFKVIRGHRVWYQSKAHLRLPISD